MYVCIYHLCIYTSVCSNSSSSNSSNTLLKLRKQQDETYVYS